MIFFPLINLAMDGNDDEIIWSKNFCQLKPQTYSWDLLA